MPIEKVKSLTDVVYVKTFTAITEKNIFCYRLVYY